MYDYFKALGSAHPLKNFRPKENGIAKKKDSASEDNYLLSAIVSRTHL